MNPEFKDGDLILTHSLLYKPSVGDVVAVMYNKKTLIKRISKIFKDTIEIIGDNKEESTDSRSFGEINKNQILGKVIMKI